MKINKQRPALINVFTTTTEVDNSANKMRGRTSKEVEATMQLRVDLNINFCNKETSTMASAICRSRDSPATQWEEWEEVYLTINPDPTEADMYKQKEESLVREDSMESWEKPEYLRKDTPKEDLMLSTETKEEARKENQDFLTKKIHPIWLWWERIRMSSSTSILSSRSWRITALTMLRYMVQERDAFSMLSRLLKFWRSTTMSK